MGKDEILAELDEIIKYETPYSRNPLDDIMAEDDDEEVE